MGSTTYAQALAVTDPLTIEAALLADVAGQGEDLTGYDDFSTPKALINEQARARNLEQQIRAVLAQTVDPVALAALSDDWVDVVLMGAYQEPRIAALPTIGTLIVTVAAGSGPYTYQAGDILVQDVTTGAYFANADPIPMAASSSAPGTLTVQSTTTGASTNPIGTPTWKLISAPSGASLGLSFGTWVRSQAGRDPEASLAYVTRCQAKWGGRGYGGNLDAYDYWIPTGTPAITRWAVNNSNPNGPGSIDVSLADSAGPATSGEIASVLAYLLVRKGVGTGVLRCFAAPLYTDTISCQLLGDGTNPNLAANATAALAALSLAFPMSSAPIFLTGGLVGSVLMGGAFSSISVVDASGANHDVAINLPGFGGCAGIVALTSTGGFGPAGPSGSGADVVPANAVLELIPNVTVA